MNDWVFKKLFSSFLTIICAIISGSLLLLAWNYHEWFIVGVTIANVIICFCILHSYVLLYSTTDKIKDELQSDFKEAIKSLSSKTESNLAEVKNDLQGQISTAFTNYDTILGQHLGNTLDAHLTQRVPEITTIVKGSLYQELLPYIIAGENK